MNQRVGAQTNFMTPEDYQRMIQRGQAERDQSAAAAQRPMTHWTQALASILGQGFGQVRMEQAENQKKEAQGAGNEALAAYLRGDAGALERAMSNPYVAQQAFQLKLQEPQREFQQFKMANERANAPLDRRLRELKLKSAETDMAAQQRQLAQREQLMKLFTAPAPTVAQPQPTPQPAPTGAVGPQGPEPPPNRFDFGQAGVAPTVPSAGPSGAISPNAPIEQRLEAMPAPSAEAKPIEAAPPTEAAAPKTLQEQIAAMSPVARQRAAMLISAGKVDDALELVMEQSAAKRLGGYKDEKQRFDAETKVRTEFQKVTQDFRTVRDSLTVVRSATENPSPAGDLSMIYAYMRMLDPGSVVRESEFAMAARAGSLPTRWQNLANQALSGTLTDKTRNDFKGRAEKIYLARRKNYTKTEKQYSEFAKRKGFDPKDIIFDYRIAEEADPAAALKSKYGLE